MPSTSNSQPTRCLELQQLLQLSKWRTSKILDGDRGSCRHAEEPLQQAHLDAAGCCAQKLADLIAEDRLCDAVAVTSASNATSSRTPFVRSLLAAASPVIEQELRDKIQKTVAPSKRAELRLPISTAGLRCALAFASDAVPAAWKVELLEMKLADVRAASLYLQMPHLEEWWQEHCRKTPMKRPVDTCRRMETSLVPAVSTAAVNGFLLIASVVLALASCLVWLSAMRFNFMDNVDFMDNVMIQRNPSVYEPLLWDRLLRTDYWGLEMLQPGVWSHKSFRPLTVYSFHLSYWLHGFNSTGWHTGNIFLHATASGLLAVFGRLAVGLSVGWAAALFVLFFSHPVHTESVLYIMGRADLICCNILLITALLYTPLMRSTSALGWFRAMLQVVAATFLILLAGLAKETGFCFYAFLLGWEVLSGLLAPRQTWPLQRKMRCFALLVLGSLVCYVRVWYTSGTAIQRMDAKSNPIAATEDFQVRALSYALVHGLYAKLLVWPSFLCYDYSLDAVPLVHSLGDCRALLPLAAYSMMCQLFNCALWPLRPQFLQVWSPKLAHVAAASTKAAREGPILGVAILMLSFLPMSNILFPVGTVIAERLLYIPSAGLLLAYCALSQLAVARSASSRSLVTIMLLAYVTVASIFTFKTAQRVPDWATAESIIIADGLKQRRSAKTQLNLGNAFAWRRRYDEAIAAYQQAMSLMPQRKEALPAYYSGQIMMHYERFAEAEGFFQQALAGYFSPLIVKKEDLWHEYAVSLWSTGKAQEAVDMFHRSLEAEPTFAKAWNNLACAATLGVLQGKLPNSYLEYAGQAIQKATDADVESLLYWRNTVAIKRVHSQDLAGAQAAWKTVQHLDPDALLPAECTSEVNRL